MKNLSNFSFAKSCWLIGLVDRLDLYFELLNPQKEFGKNFWSYCGTQLRYRQTDRHRNLPAVRNTEDLRSAPVDQGFQNNQTERGNSCFIIDQPWVFLCATRGGLLWLVFVEYFVPPRRIENFASDIIPSYPEEIWCAIRVHLWERIFWRKSFIWIFLEHATGTKRTSEAEKDHSFSFQPPLEQVIFRDDDKWNAASERLMTTMVNMVQILENIWSYLFRRTIVESNMSLLAEQYLIGLSNYRRPCNKISKTAS